MTRPATPRAPRAAPRLKTFERYVLSEIAPLLFGTLDTGGVDADLKLDAINRDIVTVLKALVVLFIAAGGFLSRRLTSPPPPALAAAADRHETPAAADVTKTLTPQPNVAQASEDITREGNK